MAQTHNGLWYGRDCRNGICYTGTCRGWLLVDGYLWGGKIVEMTFKMPCIVSYYFDHHGNCYSHDGRQKKPTVLKNQRPYYELGFGNITMAEIIQYGKHLKAMKNNQ